MLSLRNLFDLATHVSYYYLVKNYFNPAALANATWSIQVMPVGSGTQTALSQRWVASANNALAVAADVLLTGILIISLYQQSTGFERTDSVINVLMLYTINIGLLQTIVNTVVLVYASIAPLDLVFIGIGIGICTLILFAGKALDCRMRRTEAISSPQAYPLDLHPIAFNLPATYAQEHSLDPGQTATSADKPRAVPVL
ncbi:hypothetical protein BV20DRAFT_1052332 [Pilatotrama ljubarskyi]|nr:hypothetical protein BV20DRAFT_1052332 [Pilatotrama ljubarskyi]